MLATSDTYRMPFGPWKVLRNRNYAMLSAVSALSDFGTWMQIGALGIFVTQSTGEARWTGIAGTITYLTAGLFAPLGGVLADRQNRKRLILGSYTLQAFLGFVLAYAFAHGVHSPLPLIALAGLEGAVTAAVVPAVSAMIPDIVPKKDLANAAFLEQISWNVGRAFGPIVAVAVVHAQSYTAVFVLNAISFAAVALCVPFIRVQQHRNLEGGSLARRLNVGFRGLLDDKLCLFVTLIVMVDMALISPFIAFIPAMGQLTLHGTASTSAALFVAQGIGSALGAFVIGSVMHRFGQGRTVVALSWLQPFMLLAYALSPDIAVAVILITLLGAIHTSIFSLGASMVQQYAEPHLRGRIVSLNRSMLVFSYGVTSSVLGLVATQIGLRETFITVSVASIACLGLLTLGPLNRLTHVKEFDSVADLNDSTSV